jgi:hypothetical protein
MRMTLEEFEKKFFDPQRVTKYLENRTAHVDAFSKTEPESRWTVYFMLLGGLAAGGRISPEEFQAEGPNQYAQQKVPTPERLYALTALVDLLK